MAEVSKMLALSTGHLTEQTCNQFLRQQSSSAPIFEKHNDYGWFVYVDTDFGPNPPEDLQACLEYARTFDCEWVMFDRDVDPVPQLLFYDW